MGKTAVILLNLGGPDSLDSVKPFLYNLFNDPAIINLPTLIRTPLAKLISSRRYKEASEIYENLGGKSPLLENTELQAQELEKALGDSYKVFIAMRYWHPRAEEVVQEVKAGDFDQIVLCPLYPQFSSTTTLSSLKEWKKLAGKYGLDIKTRSICCYYNHPTFIAAICDKILEKTKEIDTSQYRFLFAAHGLPKKIVEKGDPYQRQVEKTVDAIVARLPDHVKDYVVCYQSRVGPLEWIQPYIEDEIQRVADDNKGLIIVPVAFVSEHSETLVELDIEYKELADELGIQSFVRIPTVDTHHHYIHGLKDFVQKACESKNTLCRPEEVQACGAGFSYCPWNNGV